MLRWFEQSNRFRCGQYFLAHKVPKIPISHCSQVCSTQETRQTREDRDSCKEGSFASWLQNSGTWWWNFRSPTSSWSSKWLVCTTTCLSPLSRCWWLRFHLIWFHRVAWDYTGGLTLYISPSSSHILWGGSPCYACNVRPDFAIAPSTIWAFYHSFFLLNLIKTTAVSIKRSFCEKWFTLVFDQVLSTKVYGALQALRTVLVNEAGGDLMPYHIMGFVTYFHDSHYCWGYY